MGEIRDKIGNFLGNFFESIGIDKYHGATILFLILAISYSKDLKYWSELAWWRKSLIFSTIGMSIFTLFMSIFRIIGIIKMN